MSNPHVSVVMAVYNTQEYVSDAIESILCQTYNDFEFIIIEDGSSDDSLNIIQSYSDPRIKVIRNKENLKLIKSLNLGLQKACGRYIIRMDADDVSRPDRIEKQVNYMESHPDCVLCGTSYRTFGDGVTSRNIVTRVITNLSVITCCPIHTSYTLQPAFDERSLRSNR